MAAHAKMVLTEVHKTHSYAGGGTRESIGADCEVEWPVKAGLAPKKALAYFTLKDLIGRDGARFLVLPKNGDNTTRVSWTVRQRKSGNAYGAVLFVAEGVRPDLAREQGEALRRLWREHGEDAMAFAEMMGD